MTVKALEIKKINSQPGDGHQDGDIGYAICTIGPDDMLMYGVLWDDYGIPVFMADYRTELTCNSKEIDLSEEVILYLEQVKDMNLKYN